VFPFLSFVADFAISFDGGTAKVLLAKLRLRKEDPLVISSDIIAFFELLI
jgi:hypothetical protein